MAERIVVAGSLAQRPGQGGHTWVFLNYLLGLKRLGWDILFVDRLEPEMCVDRAGRPCSLERSWNLDYFMQVMERFGLHDDFALLYDQGRLVVGRPRAQMLEHTRQAALLLNVMGYILDEELLACAHKRVFLDIDPGFGQMWQALDWHDLFEGHDAFVTIGENIGQSNCTIPTCGRAWITARQPVVLDRWPAAIDERMHWLTTVGSWRGPFGPIAYQGRSYGLRVHEFRRFATLPRRSGADCRIALDIHQADGADRALLVEHGWTLLEPRAVAADPWAYRAFIQGSGAELMVAKNMYVQSKSGWFSDRSICYLASGKPVLAQDTGLGERYPTGEGLILFTTLDQACAGVAELSGNYRRHARAARDLAEAYFDSDRVLGRLLAALGVA